MCKCGKSIFLQSSDGQYYTNIKGNKIRLIHYDREENPEYREYIEEQQEINYCPMCGRKLGGLNNE